MKRVAFFGIVALVVIVGTAFAITILFFNKQAPTDNSEENQAPGQIATDENTRRVFVKDFHTFSEYFNLQKQRVAEGALYSYVSQRETVPDLYTGVIRPGSFSQSVDPNGAPINKLVVDISPVDLTYFLESTGSSGAITIKCAPDEEQKNTSIECIDGVKRRE